MPRPIRCEFFAQTGIQKSTEECFDCTLREEGGDCISDRTDDIMGKASKKVAIMQSKIWKEFWSKQ